MRPSINSILSLVIVMCFSLFSINNVNADNNAAIECEAAFQAFPEGTLAFFEPFNYYDDATYFWDFGDGNSSTETNPVHEYEINPDIISFEVILTITLADGETCTFTEVFVLQSEECTSMFDYFVENNGLTVNFEDTSWGIITSWFWDFGDGNTSDSQHPTHVYAESGDYNVLLKVECLGDQINEMVMPVSVFYEPQECYSNFEILNEFGFLWFHAAYINGATYHWDFGDGNTITSDDSFVQHNYEGNNGDEIEVVVTLTVMLPDGQSCSTSQDLEHTIFIECNSMFTSNSNNNNPLLVYFYDESWGEVVSWNWDFGDGNNSNEQFPTHEYADYGEYVVILTIECQDGQVSEMSMVVNLEYEPIECDASFSMDWNLNEYFFFPSFQDSDATYHWDFGDGNTSVEQQPIHTYNGEPGDIFTVTLVVTLPDGEACDYVLDIVIDVVDECTSMFDYWPISDNGLTIEFQDQSWGNVIAWTWDFGDGNSSSEQHPIHTYTAFGDYEVFLTIDCSNGEINTMVMPVHVGNGGDCDAAFWYGQELNQVYFYPNFESPETTYLWDFGDGNTSTEIHPVHEYELGQEPMEVHVTLTLTLADGTSCNYTELVFLEPLECTSMFEYYAVDDNELEVQFWDTSWGIPTSWTWDFGDGNTSSEQNPIHEYAEAGVYNVTLTIDCVGGETNSIEMPAHVGEVLFCDAGFSYEVDFSINTFYFYPYTFMDDAIYNWDFGDGNTSNELNPVHTYTQGQDPIEYPVTLELILPDGQICTYTEFIFLEPVECNAMFEYGPAPDNNMVVAFWDTSWGTVTSWLWDFGDGSTSTEQNPTHTFTSGGIHYVTLTITCAGGEVNTITMEVYTNDVPPCEAAFNYYLLDDGGVYFESELIYEDAHYYWDFGDGGFSEEMTPTYFYMAEGWYPIFLEIVLPNGTFCYFEDEIHIGADNPDLPIHCEAFFSFEQTDDPMTIHFFNQSFTDNDQIELQWHFGDGVTSTETNPVHHFETAGAYIVTLTIISGDCVDTFPMQIFVGDEVWYPDGCQALFLPVETNSGFIFYDLSQGIVIDYLWDFGDGNLSTNTTPFHEYAFPGEYDVTLTITTADGCESTFSILISNTGFMGNAVQAYMISNTEDLHEVIDLNVFPNPASEQLNVSFNMETSMELSFEINTLNGVVLDRFSKEILEGQNLFFIDVNQLPQGIYILTLKNNDLITHKRFVKN